MGLILIFYITSFIPPVREYFKKSFNGLFIFLGGSLFFINILMSIFIAPRLVKLYEEYNKAISVLDLVRNFTIVFILSILLIIIGWKFKNISRSNLRFHLMFTLLVIISWLIVQIFIVSIIDPIYMLTSFM